jgi:hypothetical protein
MNAIYLEDRILTRLKKLADVLQVPISEALAHVLDVYEIALTEQQRRVNEFIGSVEMPVSDLSEQTRAAASPVDNLPAIKA